MKPTTQHNDTSRQRDPFAPRRKGSTAPQIDCQFQATSADFRARGGRVTLPFRAISRDYFEHEAGAHYVGEAAVFTVIAITAAFPIIEAIRGLAHLVQGVL